MNPRQSLQSWTMTETEVKETKADNGGELSEKLSGEIVRQVEHYFGDYNLPRDKFLKELVDAEEGGWVRPRPDF